MPKLIDLTGKRFGRLQVIERASDKHRGVRWKCQCDCGNIKVVGRQPLVDGNTRSCGCLNQEKRRERTTTHGYHGTKTYRAWKSMMARCETASASHFEYYGGRGIKVCERWHRFENFIEDMGECPPEMSLDRIDTNGNYEKTNCRWATREQQCNNKRDNHNLTWNGKTHTLKQWSTILGINYSTIRARVNRGWDVDRVLTGGGNNARS